MPSFFKPDLFISDIGMVQIKTTNCAKVSNFFSVNMDSCNEMSLSSCYQSYFVLDVYKLRIVYIKLDSKVWELSVNIVGC